MTKLGQLRDRTFCNSVCCKCKTPKKCTCVNWLRSPVGLDAESEREVQEGIDGLLGGQTTIVIAHRLSTIFRADRILVFDKGNIAESGTHDELIDRRGLYANLLQVQMGLNERSIGVLKQRGHRGDG